MNGNVDLNIEDVAISSRNRIKICMHGFINNSLIRAFSGIALF